MSFGRELKDFAVGFKSGYEMIPDETADQKTAKVMKDGMNGAGQDASAGPNAKVDSYDTGGGFNKDGKLPAFARTPNLQGQIADYADAIAVTESGGRYGAVGPKHDTYGRPLGRYQVMESNLPEWSKEALGRVVTADEFLKNPEIQDKIFENRFGGYVQKYGNPQDAASAWFTGSPRNARSMQAKDSLGTSGNVYVEKFNNSLARVAGMPKPKSAAIDLGYNAGSAAPKVMPDRVAALDIEGEEDPTQTGVMAAEGGLVEELPPEPQTESGPTPTAVSMDPTLGGSPAAEPTAQRKRIKQSELIDHDGAASAIDGGLRFIQKAFGFDKPRGIVGADPQGDERLQAFAANAGAAEPQELDEVYNTVDPNGTLSDDQRQVAGFNAVYKYWMEKGDPVRAQKAAAGMMMASKKVIAMSGSMALAAHENGDIQGMVDAVIQGKNQIPDGESVRATKISEKGVEYEIVDNSGKVKSKGKATIDQMVELAGQMQSGAAWFDQMTTASRGKTGKERETDKRQAALDIWNKEEANSDEGFMSTLSPERRAAFSKLHPTEQNRVRQQWAQEQRSKKAEDRWNTNRNDRLGDKLDDDQWREFKESVRKDEWTTMREDRMSAAERQEAQRQQDLDDRNRRQQLSFEERRKRNAEIDEKILRKRDEKAAAAGGKPPPTLTERRERAIDIGLDERKSAIAADIPEGEYGPTEKQGVDLGLAQAGAGYQRATVNNKPDRGRIDADAETLGAKFDEQFKATPLSPIDRSAFVNAANSIREANPTVTVDDAALMAQTAVDPRAKPVVLPDGRVQLHPRLTPVHISEDAMRQLDAIRKRASGVTRTGNATGTGVVSTAQAAEPGTSAPDRGVGITDAYSKNASPAAKRQEVELTADEQRRQAGRLVNTRAEKTTERDALIKKLGPDYELMLKAAPGGVVTLRSLRQAWEDKQREGTRLEKLKNRRKVLGYNQ